MLRTKEAHFCGRDILGIGDAVIAVVTRVIFPRPLECTNTEAVSSGTTKTNRFCGDGYWWVNYFRKIWGDAGCASIVKT
jgi:hypothetical protein